VTTQRQQGTRAAALRLVRERPGLGQRELAEELRAELGVGASAAIEALRELEAAGAIVSRRDGRRKIYEAAAPEEPPPLSDDVEPPPDASAPAARPVPAWAYGAALLGAIVFNVLIVWLLVHA
jgi:DNA-binding transcriptional ArsR family regulator